MIFFSPPNSLSVVPSCLEFIFFFICLKFSKIPITFTATSKQEKRDSLQAKPDFPVNNFQFSIQKMAITYKLVQKKDMHKDAEADAKLYYAQSLSNGTVEFADVCENIAKISTASTGDVKLVLDGLVYEIKRAMKAGQIVQIEGLGNFQATVSSTGAETEEGFQASQVKTPKITFRASKELKQAAGNVSIQKTGAPAASSTTDDEEERPGGL